MSKPALTYFEQGQGELVLLFHGAASHSGQWRALTQRLQSRYKVVAFDQYGYRESAPWCGPQPMLMSDQVAPVLEYLKTQRGMVHLIGHSHGASLAALVASRVIDRVSSLSLYEPNTFRALDLSDPTLRAKYDQVRQVFGDLELRLSSAKELETFAEELLDFWLGQGAWGGLSTRLQTQLVSMMRPTVGEVYAALNSEFDPGLLQPLQERVLLMFDPQTPPLALLVSERYRTSLSRCVTRPFRGCGHLAPIFHPERVNAVIIEHVSKYTALTLS